MKTSHKIFFLPAIILIGAYLLKLAAIPNYALVVSASFLLIIISLIVFLRWELKKEKTFNRKSFHVLFFILTLIVIILPYANIFSQGLIPIIIYSFIVLSVFIYFIKINTDKYDLSKFVNPNNYRNFVFQILFLVVLNSPFIDTLPDKFYSPSFQPKYEQRKGPEIYIDEAHYNYHTSSGLYTTFANVLRKDGYVVNSFAKIITNESLQQVKILVISNALNKQNIDNWEQPVYSAFEEQEILCIRDWVENGGSLFLIADHPPFSSASQKLAAAFGFTFSDGTARQREGGKSDLFSRQNKMLLENEITNGTNNSEYVDSIITFTGQAFKIPDSATSILNFNGDYALYTPKIHNDFSDCIPEDITGYSQGAYMKFGKGRIVVFGEAAMFSGQLGAGLSWIKMGMNSTNAKNNYKLLLNIAHWLDNYKN